MEDFLVLLLSISAGTIGYLMAIFWFQPILKYREIKGQIISDLLFYDNAISSKGVNNDMIKRVLDRSISNRERAADLTTSYNIFPRLYKKCLLFRKEYPDRASFELIGLSNTEDFDEARQYIKQIQIFLRIKPPIV